MLQGLDFRFSVKRVENNTGDSVRRCAGLQSSFGGEGSLETHGPLSVNEGSVHVLQLHCLDLYFPYLPQSPSSRCIVNAWL